MSTIDITQVAGLQAVNAEGNVIGTLSVDDLTNLVANNLVKSTQNQIAAARSVSTMSEASTLAASDDYENTLPIDANPASVRTLDAAGNPKQTGISALAQVVGGLVNKLPSIAPFVKNGFYQYSGFEGGYTNKKLTITGGDGILLILLTGGSSSSGANELAHFYIAFKSSNQYDITTVKKGNFDGGSEVTVKTEEDGILITTASWRVMHVIGISNNTDFQFVITKVD